MTTRKISAERIHDELYKLDKRTLVAGFVVMRGAEHVGTVRIYFPRDGAGRLKALVADWTLPVPEDAEARAKWTRWQYGWANGYGYDKQTAALGGMTVAGVTLADNGYRWDNQLRGAGLIVIQAI